MIRKKLVRAIVLVLTTVLIINIVPANMFVQAEETTSAGQSVSSLEEYTNERIDKNYSIVSAGFSLPKYQGDQLEYKMEDMYKGGTAELISDTHNYEKSSHIVKASLGDTIELTISVPKSAVYYMSFDYMSNDDSILDMEASMMINDEYTFYEMRRLKFESLWAIPEEKSYDRYGDEVVGVPDKQYVWQNKYFHDASYRHSEPFGMELEAGENTITLEMTEGSILFGNIYLDEGLEISEYINSQKAEGNSIITIQAEDFTYRNSSSIRAICEFNPNLYPYNATKRVLNTIDSGSFKDAGHTVTYSFEAEKDGYYYIEMNYRQSDKAGFPVFMDIKIDSEIPNSEFQEYSFAYIKDYKREKLSDKDGNLLSVYLDKGIHTISMTISLDPLCKSIEAVEKIMNDINNLSLEVTKVVGTNKDKYRDFDLEKYIPGAGDQLFAWADELDRIMEDARVYNPKSNKIAAFGSITVASAQLRSLAKKPDELLYRISELATSVNSINVHLANLTDSLNKNRISFDYISFYQEDSVNKLPKNVGFFKKLWMSVVRFFASFTDQAYSVKNTNPEHLQVWVNRSRLHLDVMQKLIDSDFTEKTGIVVDLSLMPDQNKLVLANASGDSPDIATGINYAVPYNLGIREAIKDLTEFDDFVEVANRFSPGLLVPATIGDGIYALPETMNFWVLFYRTDVLGKLGLFVPNTIDEFKNMLPDLQSRGLNAYYPTAGMLGMKNFHGTTPLLYQYGANLYHTDSTDVALNTEEAIKGFTELTQLFTIYNLPKDIPNFYQHFRIGDLPIGISDFATYNLVTNAAPEIASSWDIAVVPGVATGEYDENGDEIINRNQSAGRESTIMFNSTKEREEMAWEFMKWWSSAETQTEYGQLLQITYGNEYYWNTANTEAFSNLPWKSSHKAVILEQTSWATEAPRFLSSYMLEREMSNAYNAIVGDGDNLRTTVDKAIKRVDRETKRKLEEFGYMVDEIMVKDYEIPTFNTVLRILGKTNEDSGTNASQPTE